MDQAHPWHSHEKKKHKRGNCGVKRGTCLVTYNNQNKQNLKKKKGRGIQCLININQILKFRGLWLLVDKDFLGVGDTVLVMTSVLFQVAFIFFGKKSQKKSPTQNTENSMFPCSTTDIHQIRTTFYFQFLIIIIACSNSEI